MPFPSVVGRSTVTALVSVSTPMEYSWPEFGPLVDVIVVEAETSLYATTRPFCSWTSFPNTIWGMMNVYVCGQMEIGWLYLVGILFY